MTAAPVLCTAHGVAWCLQPACVKERAPKKCSEHGVEGCTHRRCAEEHARAITGQRVSVPRWDDREAQRQIAARCYDENGDAKPDPQANGYEDDPGALSDYERRMLRQGKPIGHLVEGRLAATKRSRERLEKTLAELPAPAPRPDDDDEEVIDEIAHRLSAGAFADAMEGE